MREQDALNHKFSGSYTVVALEVPHGDPQLRPDPRGRIGSIWPDAETGHFVPAVHAVWNKVEVIDDRGFATGVFIHPDDVRVVYPPEHPLGGR